MARRAPKRGTAKPHARVKTERRVLSPDEQWANGLITKMLDACHPWQVDAVEDPARRISLLVGRGGGKTTALEIRGAKTCVRKRRAHVLYFATTRLRAKELMWYPLKDLCDRLNLQTGRDVLFNETELRCTFLRTGSVYQLSGMSDMAEIEKWRGQSYDEVQIDEAASHRAELLDVLMYQVVGPRMLGPIVLAGSAGKHRTGTFYEVTAPGSDKHRPYRDRELDLVVHDARIEERTEAVAALEQEMASTRKPITPKQWSSHWWTLEMVVALPDAAKKYPAMVELWENALQEFADNRWNEAHPVRKREYGAVWAEDNTLSIFQYRARLDDGAPWNEWDPPRDELGPDRVQIARLPLKPDEAPVDDWLYALVMDHGSSDEFALNIFAASPSDPERNILHIFCFEDTKMYARRIATLMLGHKVATDLDEAHANPGGIVGAIGWPTGSASDVKALGQNILDELLNVYGIAVMPADQQGKHAAVELVNGDLVDGKIKILKGSKLAQQVSSLQWRKDEYGFLQFPKGVADHSADCLLYGRRLLAHLFNVPGASEEKPKPKHRRDVFTDPMGLDGGPDADPGKPGEFDLLFADMSGAIDFGE